MELRRPTLAFASDLAVATLALCLSTQASHGNALPAGSVLALPAALITTTPGVPITVVQPADALNGLVVCPDLPTPIPASQLAVTIRNANNQPLPGVEVVVELGANHTVCPNADLTAITDADGIARLTVAATGCSNAVPIAARIRANGVIIRQYENVKSPDFDGASGDGTVNFPDLVDFANEFLGTSPSDCHDYNNDGATGLDDLIIHAPAFINGSHCP